MNSPEPTNELASRLLANQPVSGPEPTSGQLSPPSPALARNDGGSQSAREIESESLDRESRPSSEQINNRRGLLIASSPTCCSRASPR